MMSMFNKILTSDVKEAIIWLAITLSLAFYFFYYSSEDIFCTEIGGTLVKGTYSWQCKHSQDTAK